MPADDTTATSASSFCHQQSAHCESGVVAALLRQGGLPLSEPMVFGLSSALVFAYLPIVKINGLPLIAYRMVPRHILKKLRSRLRLPLHFETFRDPEKGRLRLDALLAEGRIVGLQGSVYFLPYFPVNMRFHFNAHNLLAFGREGDEYLISDPVFPATVRCPVEDLQRARFVRGALAPKGLLYYLDGALPPIDVDPMLRPAIRANCHRMLHAGLPFVGCAGIAMLGRRVRSLPVAKDPTYCRRFVGHVVRMQEEIGTGGAGFRFLYAAFLQEAGARLGLASLQDLSLELTAIGDQWRDFALHAARVTKGRETLDQLPALHELLVAIAAREKTFFKALLRAV